MYVVGIFDIFSPFLRKVTKVSFSELVIFCLLMLIDYFLKTNPDYKRGLRV